ncbi:hypothetical protein [Sphaerisporangium corydalis]|uniref:Uncharacterized protein n=1 Tax=Sphaerisporangium corydalis TaxID=1441875 RepID=A0ABV9E843_9ACTN|nr:hypothetical protein [Sphaerisporangium corydalis]
MVELTGNALASLLLTYWPTADVPRLEERETQVRAHAESLRRAADAVQNAARTAVSGNSGPAARTVQQVSAGSGGHAENLLHAAARADRLANGLRLHANAVRAIRAVVLVGTTAVVAASFLGPGAGVARLLAFQTRASGMTNAAAKRLAHLLGGAEKPGNALMTMGKKDGWVAKKGEPSATAKGVADQVALYDQGQAAVRARKLEEAARREVSEQAARQRRAEAELKRTGQEN